MGVNLIHLSRSCSTFAMTITIDNVAASAGVSRSTANMILTGNDGRYAPGTRQRVKQAASELGYKPNISARSLRYQRSFLVGALFNQVNNAYADDYLFGLQKSTVENGCTPTIMIADGPKSELEALRLMSDRRVDGLVVNPIETGTAGSPVLDEIHRLRDRGLPIVEVFGSLCGPDVPSFASDAHLAGYLCAKQAIEHGCERIVLLMRNDMTLDVERTTSNWFGVDFNRGAAQALIDHGQQPICKMYRVEQDPHAAARSVIGDHKPGCIITLSGQLLPYLVLLTNTQPHLVAENFALGSTSNLLEPFACRFSRSIVHLSIRQTVDQAVQALFSMINGKKLELGNVLVSPTVQWRDPSILHEHAGLA